MFATELQKKCHNFAAYKLIVRRIIFISFLVLSTSILLVYTILPHHHHNNTPCFVVEVCDEDIHGEHTHTHNIPDKDTESCIAESEYVVRLSNNEQKPIVSYIKDYDNVQNYSFPVFFLIGDFLKNEIENFFLRTEYWDYIPIYKSVESNQFHGLRAPPAFLS